MVTSCSSASTAAATTTPGARHRRLVPEVECPDCNSTFWLDGDVRDADFHLEIPEDGKVYCPFCFPSVQLWPRMEPQEAAAAARRRPPPPPRGAATTRAGLRAALAARLAGARLDAVDVMATVRRSSGAEWR